MITYRIYNAVNILMQQAPEPTTPPDTLPPMVPADPGSLLRETASRGPQIPAPLLAPAAALWTLILGLIVLVAITVFLIGGVHFARAGSDDDRAANAVRGMGRTAAILVAIMLVSVLVAIVLAVVSLMNAG